MLTETRTATSPQGPLSTEQSPASLAGVAEGTDAIGRWTVRYGLVAVLVLIGGMKFAAYEAEGISGLVSNSPLMAWTYKFLSVRGVSSVIGLSELAIAGLIALRFRAPKASACGSLLAVGMFATTLSFLFSTPGVIEPTVGFPALSVLPGQFLFKDVVLLGAALWTLGESLRAVAAQEGASLER